MTMKNDATRNDRLKAALRDNLRRRKAQSRGRSQAGSDLSGPDAEKPGSEPAEAERDRCAGAPAMRDPQPDRIGTADDPLSDKTAV